MAKLNMQIKGVDKLINKLKDFGEKGVQEIKSQTRIASEQIEVEAKVIVPKDTSRLHDSIHDFDLPGSDGLTRVISTGTNYAAYVEYGKPIGTGPNGGPRPYMYPALKIVAPKYVKELKKGIKHHAKDITR